MKKLESSITNMVLVLTLVAVIASALLATINNVTAGPVAEQAAKTLSDGIKAVMGGVELTVAQTDTVVKEFKGKEFTFVAYKTTDEKGEALGTAVTTVTGGFGGDLKVLVGFDPEGNILGYTLLEHAETPGLGAKADAWFQADGKGCIIGKNPGKDDLTVTKDGGTIDAITASTITSRAFLLAVTQAYAACCGEGAEGAACAEDADAETAATSQNN